MNILGFQLFGVVVQSTEEVNLLKGNMDVYVLDWFKEAYESKPSVGSDIFRLAEIIHVKENPNML